MRRHPALSTTDGRLDRAARGRYRAKSEIEEGKLPVRHRIIPERKPHP
jgi:hypothetical protein